MAIQFNRYYNIKSAGSEAVRLTTMLLQSYPITRACFGILGTQLLERVGFGFFCDRQEIIVQGEQGKDLFMLCDQTVEVFVDNKKVVQMEAPALFGDKGIVEPESKRAATIRVAPDKTCFFLKIPMGLFLRNFDDMSIDDPEFVREIGIYYNMFQGIQSRLFEYAFIQKNLWEEVNTTLTLARIQRLVKTLDNRVDEGWQPALWEIVRQHLQQAFKFSWPEGIPLDSSTFRNLLRQHLDEKYPRSAYQGKDADYIKRKHQIWRKWLTATASVILKELPATKEEIDGSQIQLFNPRNYQLRIQGLIKAIEKKFLASKLRDLEKESSGAEIIDGETIKSFFGKTEQNNTFDLQSYLNSFEQTFKLKYPKRMQTQIAQRTALVAAKCENEFNESVAAMKTFLEKSQSQPARNQPAPIQTATVEPQADRDLDPLLRAIATYYKHLNEPVPGKFGKVTYKHGSTPTLGHLIKTAGTKQVREEVTRAIHNQITKLNLTAKTLTAEMIKSGFYLCEAAPGFEIQNDDLEKHYWLPLAAGAELFAGEIEYGQITPGNLIGGRGWIQPPTATDQQTTGPWKLKIQNRSSESTAGKSCLLLVLPNQSFPWETNRSPNPATFKTVHLPVMQWLINKQIDHLLELLPVRDDVFQNWLKTEQVVRLENKVNAFENSSVTFAPSQQIKIMEFVENIAGLKLDKTKSIASNKLAKQIYNHILKQMTVDYSELPAEQLGNKTYTKWRLILSEIVQITEQATAEKTAASSTPFLEIIENELNSILTNFTIPKSGEFIRLTGPKPFVLLAQILEALNDPAQDRQLLFDLILSTLETYLRLLWEEIRMYRQKYEIIARKRPQTDVQTLQTKTIMENAAKLKDIILQKQAGSQPPADIPTVPPAAQSTGATVSNNP